MVARNIVDAWRRAAANLILDAGPCAIVDHMVAACAQLKMFIDQGDELTVGIDLAFKSTDIVKLGSLAHKLKGSALNLGAESVAESCRRIELNAREKDMDGMEEHVKKLIRDFGQTKKELETIMSEP